MKPIPAEELSQDIIKTFETLNQRIVFGIKLNRDRNFDKLSIPISDLIIPKYDERQVLTHFEVNPTLMKLAYLKDYRNTDTIKEGMRT